MTRANRSLPAIAVARAGALAILTFLLLPIGGASAATTVTPHAADREIVLVAGKLVGPPGVVLGSSSLVHLARGAPGPTTRAGVQSAGLAAVSGTTATLAACATTPCTDPYRGAGTPHLRVGDWGVEVVVTVTQPPAATGTATGFALQVAIHTATGWTVAVGYVSTGTNPSATSRTINLDFYIDLGVTARPTLLATDVVLSPCASAAVCR